MGKPGNATSKYRYSTAVSLRLNVNGAQIMISPRAAGSRAFCSTTFFGSISCVARMLARHSLPCNATCAEFLSNASVARWDRLQLEPPLEAATVAFVACNGIDHGGPQLRCVETARLLTLHGMAAICWGGHGRCSSPSMQHLLTTARKLEAIVFCKSLPSGDTLQRVVRPLSLTLVLDTMDLSPRYHPACKNAHVTALLNGVIANSPTAWRLISHECPALATKDVVLIEHFHSVTRRVSHGEAAPRRALLVQEHRAFGNFCSSIAEHLPETTTFDCNPLWGGAAAADSRERFFMRQLSLPRAIVRSIASQPRGAAALFTTVFSKFDLLLQWWPTSGSAQRLANALATGIPAIALTCQAFEDAFGRSGVLLAHNLSELRTMARTLDASATVRAGVSNAGVAAAAAMSPDAIATLYRRALRRWRARRLQRES